MVWTRIRGIASRDRKGAHRRDGRRGRAGPRASRELSNTFATGEEFMFAPGLSPGAAPSDSSHEMPISLMRWLAPPRIRPRRDGPWGSY